MGESEIIFKVLIIGKYDVGKVTLQERIAYNEFYKQQYISGIGVDFKIKNYKIEGKRVIVQYWDTAGQERFGTICRSTFRGSKGIYILFDLNDPKSFDDVEFWFNEMNNHFEKPPPVFLIGSKSDLEQRVSERMIIKLSNKLGNLPIYYCSSLNGNGINKMENDLINLMLKLKPEDVVQRKQEIKQESNWYCYLV